MPNFNAKIQVSLTEDQVALLKELASESDLPGCTWHEKLVGICQVAVNERLAEEAVSDV